MIHMVSWLFLGPFSWFAAPFVDYAFMRRALVGCLAVALGSAPTGVFLMLRRMSLIGDTLAHAILPGAAIGFILAGLSLPAMSLGGFVAGSAVALLSGMVSRATRLKEDASLASFFLISLATGVLLVSMHGSTVDLIHVLFGSILAVDDQSLMLMATVASGSLLTFAVIYRGLVADCFDPGFLGAMGGAWGGGRGAVFHTVFLLLLVANMVSGFQALGSLMAVGLMILPATASQFWARQVWSMIVLAFVFAFAAAYVGLLCSFWFDLPAGPAIILTAGAIHVVSLIAGPRDGIVRRRLSRRHVMA